MAATKKTSAPARAGAPSKSVRGSRTGRPIMAILDLLGRRWALRVLWELRGERKTFRALQDACDGVSPAVLNGRVRELRDSGLVDLGEAESEGYGLSPLGRELLELLAPVTRWADRWAARK